MELDAEKAMNTLAPRPIEEIRKTNGGTYSVRNLDKASSGKKVDSSSANGGPGKAESTSSKAPVPTLDPNEPGPWLLHHHKKNLIRKLDQPKLTFTTCIFNEVSKMVSKAYDKVLKDKSGGVGAEVVPSYPDEENNWAKRRFRISFAELQRMHLRKLQCKVVKDVVDMYDNDDEVPGWEGNLQQYIKALKDYDYMKICSQKVEDPFLATSERFIDMAVIASAMDGVSATFHSDETFKPITSIGKWRGVEDSSLIGGTRHNTVETSELKNFNKRLGIAAFGGVFLLAPMWLMVLHHTLYTSLISTTICVIIFGSIMAVYVETVSEVLVSTSAYAAVLVVFVGLNTHF